jgi:hypothetical protein
MWPDTWFVIAVLLAMGLTAWVALTATRLDRLHARIDAAQAALDAQLVRRAAALLHLVEMPGSRVPVDQGSPLAEVARRALDSTLYSLPADRQFTENAVGRGIAELSSRRDDLAGPEANELAEAAARVLIARRFFNDAVRDTRTLRGRRMPRLLHLAGHREQPQFFDIDDSVLFEGADSPTGRASG